MNQPKYPYNAVNIVGALCFVIYGVYSVADTASFIQYRVYHIDFDYFLSTALSLLMSVAIMTIMAICLLGNLRCPGFPAVVCLVTLYQLGLCLYNIANGAEFSNNLAAMAFQTAGLTASILYFACLYGKKPARRTGIRLLWFLPALFYLVHSVLHFLRSGPYYELLGRYTILLSPLMVLAMDAVLTVGWVLAGLWITAVPVQPPVPVSRPPMYQPPAYRPVPQPPVYQPPVPPQNIAPKETPKEDSSL